MRIVSANLFCLNPRPGSAVRAVAEQRADVVILIEAVKRFDRFAMRMLPPRRAIGYTRARGMPVALHARPDIPIDGLREDRLGWLEARVGDLTLLAVHALAPYLPWRWPRRERQLIHMARRMNKVAHEEPGLAIGDYNTADFEKAWERYERAAAPWRRIDHPVHGPGRGRHRGTWLMGQTWSPVAVDHALATPLLADIEGGGIVTPEPAGVRTFAVPGSDHLGLVVDLPAEVVGLEEPVPLRAAGSLR